MSAIVGYPTPGKDKARLLLEAFCIPAGGKVVDRIPAELLPGPAAFYGVTPATRHLWQQARREGRDYYYIDNAYFDSAREVYFRITRNRLQHDGRGESDGSRFTALKVAVKPWRGAGKHILICPQSDEFMTICAEYPGSWLEDVLRDLRMATQRELRVRPWNRDKKAWYASLPADLENCHALVTYSSASAMTALLSGVTAFATAEDCVTSGSTSKNLMLADYGSRDLELEGAPAAPWRAREMVAKVAADNQWTVAEMRQGLPWSAIGR